MPQNLNVIVKCQKKDCYWNIDDKKESFENNCANIEVRINDKECVNYIKKSEALKAMAKKL